jgi:hypothetical protein
MSRGPGWVEREVAAAIQADPSNAFTVLELSERIYGCSEPEKKHRVSVLRAARRLAKEPSPYGLISRQGVGAAIYTRISAASQWMAEAKLEYQRMYCRRNRLPSGWSFGPVKRHLSTREVEEMIRAHNRRESQA